MTKGSWDRVHTVNDYWDHPRRGVADFQGKPHIYESQFLDMGEEDRQRHVALKSAIGDRLTTRPERSVVRSARFRADGRGWNGYEVQWIDLDP